MALMLGQGSGVGPPAGTVRAGCESVFDSGTWSAAGVGGTPGLATPGCRGPGWEVGPSRGTLSPPPCCHPVLQLSVTPRTVVCDRAVLLLRSTGPPVPSPDPGNPLSPRQGQLATSGGGGRCQLLVGGGHTGCLLSSWGGGGGCPPRGRPLDHMEGDACARSLCHRGWRGVGHGTEGR